MSANGAAYKSTPCILRELGADVTVAHNDAQRHEHQRRLRQHLSGGDSAASCRESGAQIGITHDGDADRVLLCDENGEIVDGDEILAIAAVDFLRGGQLRENTLVATVMSNFGLDEALAAPAARCCAPKSATVT